jgi:hypothetical protein
MSAEHWSDRARDFARGNEAIVEALDEIQAALTPPLTPREDHLVEAVLECAIELRGIRALMVRLLNEYERANDVREEA